MKSSAGQKVRVAIVGAGWWADEAPASGVHGHPEAERVAICSRTCAKAETMARKFGVPRVFLDYRELMEAVVLSSRERRSVDLPLQ